jgi:hypothetical protein
MYRINKRIILLFIIILTISLNAFADKKKIKEIKTEYPLLEDEINYDIDKLIEGLDEKDDELYNYAQDIIHKEHDFLNTKEKVSYDDLKYIGNWKLVDKKGNEIERNYLNFDEWIVIKERKSVMVLSNFTGSSSIYKGENGRYYIYTRWANIIRMLQFVDGRIYVYIVRDGKWVLDPIHDGGKYVFEKREVNAELIIP